MQPVEKSFVHRDSPWPKSWLHNPPEMAAYRERRHAPSHVAVAERVTAAAERAKTWKRNQRKCLIMQRVAAIDRGQLRPVCCGVMWSHAWARPLCDLSASWGMSSM